MTSADSSTDRDGASASPGPAPARHASGAGGRRYVCGVLGLTAAGLYVAFLTRIASHSLNTRTSFVSELAARDQPAGVVFRLTDLGAGILIVVLAVGVWSRLAGRGGVLAGPAGQDRGGAGLACQGRSLVGLAGCGWLAVVGLATIAVALLPMDCPVTADLHCRTAEHAGQVSWSHQGHTVVSVVAATASLAGMGLLGWAVHTVPGWRVAGWWGLATLPPSAGLCLAVSIAVLERGSPSLVAVLTANLGVAQRVQLLLLASWIAVLATSMMGCGPAAGKPSARAGTPSTRAGQPSARAGALR